MVRLAALGDREAVAALGRPAPAGRAGAGDREPPARPPARRAARRARPQAPPGDAGRAEADPAGGRDHVRVRDPRPGRGAHDVRPARRLQRGKDRADRTAGARVRAPADRVHRGVRRGLERHRAGREQVHREAREDPPAGGRRAAGGGRARRGRASSTTSSTRGRSRATTSGSSRATSSRFLRRTGTKARRRCSRCEVAGCASRGIRSSSRKSRKWRRKAYE